MMDINSLVHATIISGGMKYISEVNYTTLIFCYMIYLLYKHFDKVKNFYYTHITSSNSISMSVKYEEMSYSFFPCCISPQLKGFLFYYMNNKWYEKSRVVEYYDMAMITYDYEKKKFEKYIILPSCFETIKIGNFVLRISVNIATEKKKESIETKVINILFELSNKNMRLDQLLLWLDVLNKKYESFLESLDTRYLYLSKENDKGPPFKECRYNYFSTKTFDNIFFKEKHELINRLEIYKDTKRYAKLGIPHTLGFLFSGEPGCGKTSTIKCIANYLNRDIVCVDLNILTIHDLRGLFMNNPVDEYYSSSRNKRIYVFEEIDCIGENNPFLKREYAPIIVVKEKKETEDKKPERKMITTSELLECFDGMTETDDRIIILTTNHPEKIDPAFLRPGRIDVKITFGRLRKEDVNDFYKLWFNEELSPEVLDKMEDHVISQAELGKLFFENSKEKIIEKLTIFN